MHFPGLGSLAVTSHRTGAAACFFFFGFFGGVGEGLLTDCKTFDWLTAQSVCPVYVSVGKKKKTNKKKTGKKQPSVAGPCYI